MLLIMHYLAAHSILRTTHATCTVPMKPVLKYKTIKLVLVQLGPTLDLYGWPFGAI